MSEWISVDERLPELAISQEETVANGFRMPSNKRSGRCLVVVNGHVTESCLFWRSDYPERKSWLMAQSEKVTHWMPLPSPPGG